MSPRGKLIAGNWKMNGLRADGLALARDIAARASARSPACDLLVCPPATLIAAVGEAIAGSGVALGGQDCHAAEKGACTGDISAEMLKDAGCAFVIVGHSERRHGCGETGAEREAGREVAVVCGQAVGSLPDGASADRLVIAYEPVWAIGTGLTPTLADIAAIHQAIRAAIPTDTRVLYGGSVNPKNAAEILALDGVDGALVGGASLKAEDFWAIAEACRRSL